MKTYKNEKQTTEIKRLKAVIDRIGEIFSEEFGCSETEFEEEINCLLMKRKQLSKRCAGCHAWLKGAEIYEACPNSEQQHYF